MKKHKKVRGTKGSPAPSHSADCLLEVVKVGPDSEE